MLRTLKKTGSILGKCTSTFFFLVDVFIFGVRNVDGDLGLVSGSPLEEKSERDVVAISCKFPEQRRSVFVGWDSNCDRFAVANL